MKRGRVPRFGATQWTMTGWLKTMSPGSPVNSTTRSGQDEIDAMRGRARREIFGPERRRAPALERIGQPGRRHEIAEQGALAADIEVPAHHGAPRGTTLIRTAGVSFPFSSELSLW
jgi:hypothetical protein